jgi:hypothetical protein
MSSACAAPASLASGTSIFARRCPFVATIRIRSFRRSQSTPLRIGRLSSVDVAKATWLMSLCRSFATIFQGASNFTCGKDGNSSRGKPRSRNLLLPHSTWARCSPADVMRTGDDGSSRAISVSFFAGSVIAPSSSTSAATVVETAMSRSVPDRWRPSLWTSRRIFESTGRVVFVGMLGPTASRPSCSFSRVIVNFILSSSRERQKAFREQ